MDLNEALAEVPIVAIIRGVTPEEMLAHAEALHEAGIRVVEVPLNSPEPLESIRRLAQGFRGRLVCGAGTVLTVADADAVAEAGGEIIVSPNTEPAVIRRSIELGLTPMPGFATPSEAFQAYAAGARRLKLFPAVSFGSAHVRQLGAVLPKEASVFAVGGVKPELMGEWLAAGAAGFGVGSELYKPGQSPEDTLAKGRALATAVAGFRQRSASSSPSSR